MSQPIDTTEGTWITVDVHPEGTKLVFDVLGDLYEMPIAGADGQEGRGLPRKLTSGVAWDMQPRFSPDGKFIAFNSDRNGKIGKAGDNLWIIGSNGEQPTQVTQESYRLLNGPHGRQMENIWLGGSISRAGVHLVQGKCGCITGMHWLRMRPAVFL